MFPEAPNLLFNHVSLSRSMEIEGFGVWALEADRLLFKVPQIRYATLGNFLISLSLGFLICKIGQNHSQRGYENSERLSIKYSALCLAQNKVSVNVMY